VVQTVKVGKVLRFSRERGELVFQDRATGGTRTIATGTIMEVE